MFIIYYNLIYVLVDVRKCSGKIHRRYDADLVNSKNTKACESAGKLISFVFAVLLRPANQLYMQVYLSSIIEIRL